MTEWQTRYECDPPVWRGNLVIRLLSYYSNYGCLVIQNICTHYINKRNWLNCTSIRLVMSKKASPNLSWAHKKCLLVTCHGDHSKKPLLHNALLRAKGGVLRKGCPILQVPHGMTPHTGLWSPPGLILHACCLRYCFITEQVHCNINRMVMVNSALCCGPLSTSSNDISLYDLSMYCVSEYDVVTS